jgi:hypothetical protein
MAAVNPTLTSKQKASAERIASYGAEQRRLKEAAADRRAAAADGERVDPRRLPTPETAPPAARPSKYLS